MSDALTYLVKARPDAVGHYFAFLKDCGKHLDPKTRNLISLITKVHAQTERGFRQYLGRALREGCTPMEVLDALLMAFPALGLAKIVWAVDIILAMDLPEFDPAALHAASAGAWHDVMAAADLAPGESRRVECDGRGLFVYRATPAELAAAAPGAAGAGERRDVEAGDAEEAEEVDEAEEGEDGVERDEAGDGAAPGAPGQLGEWRVYDSRCPHQTTNIPHLALQVHTLTCPKHGWAFDVKTGACIAKGTSPLKRWPSKVDQGRLLARW
jgi:nitrite reductase/ring-hydroxylating ferredoxin subunit/alkylhydroperoxidase/carboxymuconolactone decarboxylase family protein YurZ